MARYAREETVGDLLFQTLFFGGGTPSLLQAGQISDLIDTVSGRFKLAPRAEITLEANPGTVDQKKLQGYRAAGVNRLSLGVQSFQPEELQLLDRLHSAADAVRCFENARKAGFENINLDLIFAIPGQTLRTWQHSLRLAVALQPEHISAYNLTYEEGTPLTRQLQQGEVAACNEDLQKEQFLTAIEFLEAHGYSQYEISNFARPGFACQHNQKYWDASPYLGLGVSAHSFVDNRRFWNVSNLGQYMAMLAEDRLPVVGQELLGQETYAFERVFLGLRQSRGIYLKSFETETGISFFEKYAEPVSSFLPANLKNARLTAELTEGTRKLRGRLLEIEGGFLRLTRQGILLCDSICAEFA